MYESIIKAVKKIRKNTGKKRNNLFINFVNTVGTKEKFCNCTKCKAMNILVCNDIKYILSEIIYLGLSNILLFLYFLKILKFQNINIFEVYINKFYYNDQLLELLDLEIITLEPKHEQLVLNIGIYFSSIIFINDRTVEMVIPKLIYINLVKKIEGNLTHNIFYIPMQKIIDYISINTIMYDNLYYSIMNFNKICTIYENLKLPNIDNAHYRYYKGKIILYINNIDNVVDNLSKSDILNMKFKLQICNCKVKQHIAIYWTNYPYIIAYYKHTDDKILKYISILETTDDLFECCLNLELLEINYEEDIIKSDLNLNRFVYDKKTRFYLYDFDHDPDVKYIYKLTKKDIIKKFTVLFKYIYDSFKIPMYYKYKDEYIYNTFIKFIINENKSYDDFYAALQNLESIYFYIDKFKIINNINNYFDNIIIINNDQIFLNKKYYNNFYISENNDIDSSYLITTDILNSIKPTIKLNSINHKKKKTYPMIYYKVDFEVD